MGAKMAFCCCSNDRESQKSYVKSELSDSDNLNNSMKSVNDKDLSINVFIGEQSSLSALALFFQKNQKGLVPAYVHPFLKDQNKNLFIFQKQEIIKTYQKNFTADIYSEPKIDLSQILETKNQNNFKIELNKLLENFEILGYFNSQHQQETTFLVYQRLNKNIAPEITIITIDAGFLVSSLEDIFNTATNEFLLYKFSINFDDEIWLIFEKTNKRILYFLNEISDSFFYNIQYQEELSQKLSAQLDADDSVYFCGVVEHFKKRETYAILASDD